jgi:hypothetical protein
MKRYSILFIAMLVSIPLLAGAALAGPAAKATSSVGQIAMVSMAEAAGGWTPIFTNTIKMAEQKDLFVDVSLECGLTTNTKVMSKQLQKDIATAEAMIKVRVWVDDQLAAPGEVTFARREQTLVAEFAGDITGCITEEGLVIIDDECILDESLALILDTMTANSFNFLLGDVGVGTHTVTVEALIAYDAADLEDGDYLPTNAYLGNGSVTVESVRMIKGDVPEL